MSNDLTVQPRIGSHAEPYFSVAAKDAFVDVLTAANRLLIPRLRHHYINPVTDLDQATQKARGHCNAHLGRLALTYQRAALACFRGEMDRADSDEAREEFIRGCRVALGTD
ncbi:hypothetical protein [Streptomyces cucumeris]|uniref:hypothetical protein n=1 Tax=Streptomyces cucumeris TaxID=2962890 RepID=UPI0020C8BDCE|nr:hypothetical protein [Streptomyces sp. NEAU-Y11]MCP9209603.1 hypothetical protein [Streptomyces sp. NEAU-Y11]